MTNSRRATSRLAGAVALLVAVFAPLPALAQMVVPPQTNGTYTTVGGGLTITYDYRWVEGCGYRPVSIEITSVIPSPADRTLHLEYSTYSWYHNRPSMLVEQDIEIPAGATAVSATLATPEHISSQRIEVNASIDGVKSKSHSFQTGVTNTMSYGQGWEEGIPCLLVVGDQAPDTSVLSQLFETSVNVQQQFGPVTANGVSVAQLPGSVTLTPDRLPERALDYTSVDLICLSADQLQSLAADRPEALRAIGLWCAAGGNLLVHGAGADWSRLAEIESALALQPLGDAETAAARGWTLPDDAHYHWRLKNYLDSSYAQYTYSTSVTNTITRDGQQINFDDPQQLAALKPSEPPFAIRDHSLGKVVALAADNPFPGFREQWGWLFNQLGADRYLWYARHGMSLKQGNPEFDHWLIPGVGMAPVTAFRLLITLFVIVIGPLNYWVLWKRGRLQWLLVIVPAFAALVTAGLFAYAMMSDGLGVRVRARSYTEIDQRRGEAVCWARLSYYAGLAPAEGLVFPADVAVYPLQEHVMEPWRQNSAAKLVRWSDEGQQLASGWIQSRVLAQFVTVRARATTSGLQFTGLDGAGTPQVKNLLGTRIERLLAVGPDGALWRAENVAAGATATLAPASEQAALDEALKQMRAAIQAQPLRRPVDLEPHDSLLGDTSDSGNAGVMPDPSPARSRMERGIYAASMLSADTLAPRTYAALVDRSPEVAFGVRAPEEEASLHVVVGKW